MRILGVPRAIGLLPITAAILFPVQNAQGACTTANSLQGVTEGTSAIHLRNNGVDSSVMTAATGEWAGCAGYGVGIPSFSTSTGEVKVDVYHHNGACPSSNCGCGRRTNAVLGPDGGLSSAEIHLYTETNSGTSCTGHESDTLAHELGHILGLNDTGCAGYIMSGFEPGAGREVQSEECMVADQQWKTEIEMDSETDPEGPDGPCAK